MLLKETIIKITTMSLEEAIQHCKEKSCGNSECALEHKQLENWLTELKSLRQKNHWKPSDEQILELGIVATGKGWFNKEILSKLLEQLKKLREE